MYVDRYINRPEGGLLGSSCACAGVEGRAGGGEEGKISVRDRLGKRD